MFTLPFYWQKGEKCHFGMTFSFNHMFHEIIMKAKVKPRVKLLQDTYCKDERERQSQNHIFKEESHLWVPLIRRTNKPKVK